jgi:ABC-type uncharacterized transport system permease subunit
MLDCPPGRGARVARGAFLDAAVILMRAALLLYAAGFLTALVATFREGSRVGRATPWLAAAGALAHTAGMCALAAGLGRCPLGSLPEVLAMFAWVSILIYLGVFWRFRLPVLHLVVLPLALIILLISDILPGTLFPVGAEIEDTVLRLHLGTIILGTGALTLAFAASLGYLLVDAALKAKKPSRSIRALPSLSACDRLGRVALLVALPLLTFGILTGAVVNAAKYGHAWPSQPREVLALLAWALLAVVVVAREGWGWRGRKSALLTLFGFSLLILRMVWF